MSCTKHAFEHPMFPTPTPRAVRPGACPNAGFMAALLELDEALHGTRSLDPGDGGLCKRGKPAPRVCPICREPAGVSSGSLAVHMRARHREVAAASLLSG
jgi:atypical dual specificity phosphatase